MSTITFPSLSSNALFTLKHRYLLTDKEGNSIETPDEMFHRVARHVAGAESKDKRDYYENEFFHLMRSLKFLPNSPTLFNAGTGVGCLSACFTISPSDSMESIMQIAFDAAMVQKWGGGVGHGLSLLRSKGSPVSSTQKYALGPLGALDIYSTISKRMTQGGRRNGANMAQLHCSHPDIQEFIHCKDMDKDFENFNITVQVSQDFIEAIQNNNDWDLIDPHTKQITKTLKATDLWNEIITSAHKTGDPGIAFIDRINADAPNPLLGPILTSNPCGEEWLENYGSCNLGSIALQYFVDKDFKIFNFSKLSETVKLSIRFLNDVIEVNRFPSLKFKKVNEETRRVGLGVMGFADALVLMEIPYDSDRAIKFAEELMMEITRCSWSTSTELALERGPFPLYEQSRLAVLSPPVRNSSVTTIAPTGSINIIANCQGSGIEPFYALAYHKNVLDGQKLNEINVYFLQCLKDHNINLSKEEWEIIYNTGSVQQLSIPQKIKELFKVANEIPVESHIKILAAFQKYTTNAVSKTINMANNTTIKDVEDAYWLAYKYNLKGITIYRDGSKAKQVLETQKIPDIHYSNNKKFSRPLKMLGDTYRVNTEFGNLYVTLNKDNDGILREMFATLGKSGNSVHADLEAICRLISLALRHHIDAKEVAAQIKDIKGGAPVFHNGSFIYSVADALGKLMLEAIGENPKTIIHDFVERCPDCYEKLVPLEGCIKCLTCGYSRC